MFELMQSALLLGSVCLFDALLLAMDSLTFLIMDRLSLDMKTSGQQHAIASVLAYPLVKVILFILILVIRKKFAKAGKFACCYCIWNGGNEYRCILFN